MSKQVKLTFPVEVERELRKKAETAGLTLASYLRLIIYQEMEREKRQNLGKKYEQKRQDQRETWKKIADLL